MPVEIPQKEVQTEKVSLGTEKSAAEPVKPVSEPQPLPLKPEEKSMGAVAYLLVFGPLILFFRKESRFVQFHARQGTALFVLAVVFWFIPYLKYVLESLVLVGVVFGFWRANQGDYCKVPVVYELSQGNFKGAFQVFKNFGIYVINLTRKKKPVVKENQVEERSEPRNLPPKEKPSEPISKI